MKMKENELLPVNAHLPCPAGDGISREVPGSKIGSLVLHDKELVKTLRPIVQVFLITITIGFDAVIAPLQTLFQPTPETRQTDLIMSEENKTHIVDAVLSQTIEFQRELMFNDRDRVVAYFLVQRLRIREEKEVGIEVGDAIGGGNLAQNI
jgi:hypothetical protein